ncbi:MAG: tetratricopeptide repeat protein, partial [Sedimenticola sp.]
SRARYLVSGEVQYTDEQLRINVHLYDTETGRQVWSERYQQPFDNLFQIQERISRQIAATLSLKVSEAEKLRLANRYTRNVQAYDHFLRAQSLLLVRQKEENQKARQLYREAIGLDPSFARAYAGLALSAAADFRNQWVADGPAALESARSMAGNALQIDPEIPEVYWVLAYVNTQQRKHEKAIELLETAISLDRSFADAYALMGGVSTYMGHTAETPALIRTAMRLNPEAGYLYYLLLGRAYYFLNDWEQALINLNEALGRNPANLEAHLYLAAVLEASGDREGAEWEADEIRTLQIDFNADSWLETYPMTDPAQRKRLLSSLENLGLRDR